MEISDYTNRLATAKRNMSEAQEELKENYDRELKELEDTHEMKQEKAKKNFETAKQNLEETNENNNRFYSEETKNTIRERTNQYRKDLAEARDDFDRSRKGQKTEFDQKLTELKDGYDRSLKEQDKYYSQKLGSARETYDERYNNAKQEFDDGMERFENLSDQKFQEYKNDSNQEKRRLVSNHNNILRDHIRESSVEGTKARDAHHRELSNLRNSQDLEIDILKNNNKNSADNLRRIKNNEQEDLRKNFYELSEDISRRNQKQRESEMRANEEKMDALEKDYTKRLFHARKEASAKINTGDESKYWQDKLDRNSDQYEDRIKNIYEKIEGDHFLDKINQERVATSFQDNIRDLKDKNSKILAQKEKEANDFQTTSLTEARNKSRKAIESFKTELRKSELRNEENAIKNRDHFKRLIDNQRKNFSDTVETISEKNREGVEKLQDANRQEKSAYIEDMKKWHYNEMQELKDDLRFGHERKEMALNERQDQLVKVNEKIINEYEAKLERMADKAFKEIERLKQLHEQQRVEERREMDIALDVRERENQREKLIVKNDYEKRLGDAKDYADKQITQIVERYETQLERERDELTSKMRLKLKEAEENYRKLYQQSELEKVTMRTQYENRLEELRKSNEAAMNEKAKEFKSQFFS